jgi:hypothetical protein
MSPFVAPPLSPCSCGLHPLFASVILVFSCSSHVDPVSKIQVMGGDSRVHAAGPLCGTEQNEVGTKCFSIKISLKCSASIQNNTTSPKATTSHRLPCLPFFVCLPCPLPLLLLLLLLAAAVRGGCCCCATTSGDVSSKSAGSISAMTGRDDGATTAAIGGGGRPLAEAAAEAEGGTMVAAAAAAAAGFTSSVVGGKAKSIVAEEGAELGETEGRIITRACSAADVRSGAKERDEED